MLEVNQREAYEMRRVCGNDAIKMSRSRYPKYYLVENKRNLSALDKYRESVTVK